MRDPKQGSADDAQIAAAVDALGALWFSLDEIDAVARSIELVQEHVADEAVRAGRIYALSRAVCELVGTAKSLHGNIEEALKVT
jgi:hypothetical protein